MYPYDKSIQIIQSGTKLKGKCKYIPNEAENWWTQNEHYFILSRNMQQWQWQLKTNTFKGCV